MNSLQLSYAIVMFAFTGFAIILLALVLLLGLFATVDALIDGRRGIPDRLQSIGRLSAAASLSGFIAWLMATVALHFKFLG